MRQLEDQRLQLMRRAADLQSKAVRYKMLAAKVRDRCDLSSMKACFLPFPAVFLPLPASSEALYRPTIAPPTPRGCCTRTSCGCSSRRAYHTTGGCNRPPLPKPLPLLLLTIVTLFPCCQLQHARGKHSRRPRCAVPLKYQQVVGIVLICQQVPSHVVPEAWCSAAPLAQRQVCHVTSG